MAPQTRAGDVPFPASFRHEVTTWQRVTDLAGALETKYEIRTRVPCPGTLEVELSAGRAVEWTWQDAGLVGRALIDGDPQRFSARVEAPPRAAAALVAGEIIAMSRRVLSRY